MFETDGIGQTPSSTERYLVRLKLNINLNLCGLRGNVGPYALHL